MLFIIGILLILFLLLFASYCRRCSGYWPSLMKKTQRKGFIEKQVTLPDGAVINYAEGPDNGAALLLIHEQATSWKDYTTIFSELSKYYHIYAVDCYGHGGSSHLEEKYSIKANGDDFIWFLRNVIQKETVVSGHSTGALIAAYIAAYGGSLVKGAVLEDPALFCNDKESLSNSFSYWDLYQPGHDYLTMDTDQCWESYYLEHSFMGNHYFSKITKKIACRAQKKYKKDPQKTIQFFYLPPNLDNLLFFAKGYDLKSGEKFYDTSWHSGLSHVKLLKDIRIPVVLLHAAEEYSKDGVLMSNATDEQAQKAAELIGDCELVNVKSERNIHRYLPMTFIQEVDKFV